MQKAFGHNSLLITRTLEVLLYVHRNRRFIRDVHQDVHLDFHTASGAACFSTALWRLQLAYYVKGCSSGASQKISWEQVVTCLAHSTEHSKTSLAEYHPGGWMHGRSSYLSD